MVKRKFILTTSVLVVFLLIATFAFAQPSEQGAPKEAIDACDGMSEGDSCSFIGRQEEVGTCESSPEGEMICLPEGEKGGISSEKVRSGLKVASENVPEESKVGELIGEEPKGFFRRVFAFLFGWMKKDDSGQETPLPKQDSPSSLEVVKSSPTEVVVTIKTSLDTGQVKCYDERDEITCPFKGASFSGQDAQYDGLQLSYVNNNDETVTDSNTGLMWQQNPGEKQDYYDFINGADDFSLAGYNDWRVPTTKELYSLIDFSGEDLAVESTSGSNPFIDDSVFEFSYGDTSAGERIIDSQWMTSSIYVSTVMNHEECFFGLNFADGRIKCYGTSGGLSKGKYYGVYVRGDSYGVNDFKDNADETITDNSNSLMWQKADSGEGMNWEDALSHCEDLSLAEYTDWRLPNVKELQYVVDYARSPDTTNSAALNPIFDISEIINEAGEKDYPWSWSSTTHASQMGGDTASYVSFGRALGYMSPIRDDSGEPNGEWIDVHGAGSQRSDPKVGDAKDYPKGRGPQGDAIRIYNYVRCVRG